MSVTRGQWRTANLEEGHDCETNDCIPPVHFDESGLCAACGGCGDPVCCTHDAGCYEPAADVIEVNE